MSFALASNRRPAVEAGWVWDSPLLKQQTQPPSKTWHHAIKEAVSFWTTRFENRCKFLWSVITSPLQICIAHIDLTQWENRGVRDGAASIADVTFSQHSQKPMFLESFERLELGHDHWRKSGRTDQGSRRIAIHCFGYATNIEMCSFPDRNLFVWWLICGLGSLVVDPKVGEKK